MAKKIRRVFLVILFLALIAGGVYVAPKAKTVYDLYLDAEKKVKASDESIFKNSKTTIAYDADGNELCKIKNGKDMYYVESEDIPDTLKYAFIVMEDRTFYEHSGVDYKAIVRAAISNQKSNQIVEGASTITQQLARNMYLSHEVTWQRKIEEIFIARALEKRYDKDSILEYYLNNIYFGNGLYGVEAAAKGYFGKSVDELNISEQVFIAAIPNNPTRYNPVKNYDNTLKRRNLILEQMYKSDGITLIDYEVAKATDIVLNRTESDSDSVNDSVLTYVRHCAVESLMIEAGMSLRYSFMSQADYDAYCELYDLYYTRCEQQLLSGGYSVYTSIDIKLQASLQEAVDNRLAANTELSEDGVYSMQGAATCVDNNTGNVVAIVGQRTQSGLPGYGLNRAYQSYRQPGSAIKPLSVYTPYLQNGATPATLVNDVKTVDGPSNIDNQYDGWITLRDAVRTSKNTMAWEIYKELTPKVGVSFLQQMGFKKVWIDSDYLAGSLGGFTYGTTTEEMAGGFATLANDGVYRRTTCVIKIDDYSGNEVVNEGNRGVRVYDTNSSRMMTDILTTVVKPGGTGYYGAVPGVTMAAKTGRTNNSYDRWYCGYSRYYTTAVWIGYDYPKTVDNSLDIAGIYKDFMTKAHEGKIDIEFEKYNQQADTSGVLEPETTYSGIDETQTDTQTYDIDMPSFDVNYDPEYSSQYDGDVDMSSTVPAGEWDATYATYPEWDATINGQSG